jgi:molybdate transport system permease protein
MGEFGVALMMGGNIPGKTRVVSVALYDHVEALEYGEAHRLAFALVVLCFAALLAIQHFRGPVKA